MSARILVAVLLLLVFACGGDDSDGTGRAGDTTTTQPGAVLEVHEEWDCIATPSEMSERAALVVVAKPESDETRFAEEQPTAGARMEVLATSMLVVDVLAGEGLAAGDPFVLTRRVEYRTVTADGATGERRVTGAGFPGPPTARGYVLGLLPDGGVWTAIAGAHGRVALDGVEDDARVLDPATGGDGRLQTEYAGETLTMFKKDLANPQASPCEQEEDEHGHE